MIRDVIDRFRYRFELWWREQRDDWIGPPGTHLPDVHDYASPKLLSMMDNPKYEVLLTESTRCFAKMKTLQTILPLTMMFIMAVTGFETKASRSENEITIDYPSLIPPRPTCIEARWQRDVARLNYARWPMIYASCKVLRGIFLCAGSLVSRFKPLSKKMNW